MKIDYKSALIQMTPQPIQKAVDLLSGNKTTESFNTSSSAGGGVLAFFFLLMIITYIVAMLITWIRLVMKASSCSIGEGVAAFFLTSIYSMWKMGTLIGKDCNFSQNKGWML